MNLPEAWLALDTNKAIFIHTLPTLTPMRIRLKIPPTVTKSLASQNKRNLVPNMYFVDNV